MTTTTTRLGAATLHLGAGVEPDRLRVHERTGGVGVVAEVDLVHAEFSRGQKAAHRDRVVSQSMKILRNTETGSHHLTREEQQDQQLSLGATSK